MPPALLLLLLTIRLAIAAPFATIESITALDSAGRWRPAQETTQASVLRGDARLPVSVGLDLVPGDRIVTDDARVAIALGTAEHIDVAEHTDIEVAERTAIQRLGDAYYRVRNSFSVTYGTVQTSVDGTQFAVSGGDAVQVTVIQGRVTVRNPASSTSVRGGQSIDVPTTGAPAPPHLDLAAVRTAVASTFRAAAPTVTLGILGTGGVDHGHGALEFRGFARLRLLPGVRLTYDTGLGNQGEVAGIRLPQGLGLDFTLGGVTLRGEVVSSFEIGRLFCDGE